MPFIKEFNKDFFIKKNRIYISDAYYLKNKKYFKKITGTRFSSILNLNKFCSPVKTWAIMVNIYKDVMDPTLAKVGNIIEPKIRDYVPKLTNINFKTYDPHAINYDIFSDDNVYGGIPDGEPIDQNGNLAYNQNLPMLEIKTSSIDMFAYAKENNAFVMKKDNSGLPIVKEKNAKKESWFSNGEIIIPEEYRCQLMLYLYLRKAKKGLFAIGFLTPNDYIHPELFNPIDHEIYTVEMVINDFNELKSMIDYGREWYGSYIEKYHYSPELTDADKKWLEDELKIKL